MKDTKRTIFQAFSRHFQSFCCKIHVYWVINSLPPVCSHAIRKILLVWVRITLGFQPRVIRTQTINIFSYCMNKQGITNNVLSERRAMSQIIGALVLWTWQGNLHFAYSLARSSFNPRVLGSIPSLVGTRKLIEAGILVSSDDGWEVQRYHQHHA